MPTTLCFTSAARAACELGGGQKESAIVNNTFHHSNTENDNHEKVDEIERFSDNLCLQRLSECPKIKFLVMAYYDNKYQHHFF